MSLYASACARRLIEKHPELTPADRYVCMTLADHANRATGEAWPSVATVMEITGYSRAKVFQAFARLRELVPSRQRDRNTRVWCFAVDPTVAMETDPAETPAISTRVHDVDPKPPRNLSTRVHDVDGGVHDVDGGGPRRGPKPRKNRELTAPRQVSEHPAIRMQRERDLLELADRHFERSTTTIAATCKQPADMAWFDPDVQEMLRGIPVGRR